MMNGISLVEDAGGVSVRIPMKMKKRGGRKEITVPTGLEDIVQQTCYGNAFAVALARAHCWMEMLDSGEYGSIREMADALGLCSTYVTRLLRFTLLSPDIIQAILDGKEPDGFSQNKLVGAIPADWIEQCRKWGFERS
jgi:hypothetical protein